MKKLFYVIIGVMALLTACDDTTDTLGTSLTKQEDLINVSDGIFNISSRTVVVDSVLSRSIMGYLGKVKDPETGTYISSNFLTQFHTFENFQFPETSILPKGPQADSCQVRLFYDSFYGDSLTSMKATLYELAKPIEENQKYYTSFNPESQGYLRQGPDALKATTTYTLASGNFTDSVRNSSTYVNNISFNLNDTYTDRNGKQYNNYGTYLMQKFYENPDNFKNSYNFIHNVCPGFYVKVENGLGCMAYIYVSQLNTYFTYKDSINHTGIANFSGTEEVRQITETFNDRKRLEQLAQDNTCTYIKAPAGLMTELTLPVEAICQNHENDSINSAKVILQALANKETGEYAFSKPSTLLMVRVDDAKKFFEENKIADYRSTFVSSYSGTANSYTFSNIGELIKSMYKELPANADHRRQWKEEHPNWNKVLLIPVKASYTTYRDQSVLTKLTHDMSLSSIRLVGGSENPHKDIEVSVIYSKFKE